MLIEREVEAKLISEIARLPIMAEMEIVGARQPSSEGLVKGEQETSRSGVIAVSTGYRSHDNFSLTPITLNVSVAITTRVEMDATGSRHEEVLEALTELLSMWHRKGEVMSEALSTDRFFAGELRLEGGSGKQYDSTRSAWVESVSFSIRGAERFTEG